MKHLIFLLLTFSFLSCSEAEQQSFRLNGPAFGTTYNITYYAERDLMPEQGIDSVLDVVNQSVSTYVPGSDISRINRGDTDVAVDSIFIDVYRLSERVYNLSEGYFDPTIGVLRNAYGFGTDAPLDELNEEVIDSLRDYVGFNKVSLNPQGRIEKDHPQIYFDFNAVAKGYGIDLLGRYLESIGINHYLIELGGEVLTRGVNRKNNMPWLIGIEAVDSKLDNRKFEVKVALSDLAMASSGNYRKFRIDSMTGKKYVHTINPLNGMAEQSDVTSATVFAKTCAEADAFATAFMAMGLDKSKRLLEKLEGVDAYLTYEMNGYSASYSTPGFDALRSE